MSATMARQGGRVQLEQSDMRLALNMAKMAKGGFSCAAIEETQQLIKTPRAKVQEEKKWGVQFPRHNKLNAAIERHPSMFRQNQTDGCLPCHNGTAKIHRHAGDPKAQMHLHHEGRHLGLERHLRHLKTMRALKGQEWHPVMCIYILPFPALDLSILIHIPRITCAIKVLFQICWLMMVHPQVSTLSAAW